MKSIRHKCGKFTFFIIFLVSLTMFLIWSIGYAQEARRSSAKTSLYEMDGRLQAFNLDEKWVLIGGFKWKLADEFDAKVFAAVLELKKTGTVEFTSKRKPWATYYVILQTTDVSSVTMLKEKTQDKKDIKLVIEPKEIKRIYEQGGKIYKIVPCGE